MIEYDRDESIEIFSKKAEEDLLPLALLGVKIFNKNIYDYMTLFLLQKGSSILYENDGNIGSQEIILFEKDDKMNILRASTQKQRHTESYPKLDHEPVCI